MRPIDILQEIDMNTRNLIIAAALGAALVAVLPADVHAQAAASPPAAKSAVKQKTFATADEAAAALVDAVKARDVDQLLAVVGPGSGSWLLSGDPVADANDWKKFVAAYDEKKSLRAEGDGRAILEVGADDWPFPAPIVKKGGAWSFDTAAGREEILNRRVGRNELDAAQTLLAIVDAQREYAAADAEHSGYAQYARRFRSSPGKKDGLFWPGEPGQPQSPLGPLVATAATEGYGKKPATEQRQAYHGYYYRILTSQGPSAPGGAYDYTVGTKLLGGFAVVAWPASYGASGVTTFVVNHEGVVYEKDLGARTGAIAAAMTRYDPDATWRKTQ
jgi:hypothetical protein